MYIVTHHLDSINDLQKRSWWGFANLAEGEIKTRGAPISYFH